MSDDDDDFEDCWRLLLGFSSDERVTYQISAERQAQFKLSISHTKEACERCGSFEGVLLESSRTAYAWDGLGEDPNQPVPLCRDCAEEHHTYWDEMWKDYYSGRL